MKHTKILKIVSLMVVVVFTITTTVWSMPGVLSPSRSMASSPDTHDIDSLAIDAQIGYIEDRFMGMGDVCIALLQDAHCNYEAQINESHIIQTLIEEYGFEAVYLEGASEAIDTTLFTAYPHKQIKETVFGEALRQGDINGADYCSIMNTPPLWMHGIEQKELYEKNFRAARTLIDRRETIQSDIAFLKNAIKKAKYLTYSHELLEFDTLVEDGMHALNDNPNMADERLQCFLDLVGHVLGYIERYDVTVPDGTEFVKFTTLLKEHASLDTVQFPSLMNELDSFIVKLKQMLFRREKERRIDAWWRLVLLIEKGAALNLTQREANEYDALLEMVETKDLSSLLTHMPRTYTAARIQEIIDSVSLFYRYVKERDEVMLSQLHTVMKNHGHKKVIVVSGGFHSSFFKEQFQKSKKSYISIIPQVTGDHNSRAIYLQNLQERTSFTSTLLLWDRFQRGEDIGAFYEKLYAEQKILQADLTYREFYAQILAALKKYTQIAPETLCTIQQSIDKASTRKSIVDIDPTNTDIFVELDPRVDDFNDRILTERGMLSGGMKVYTIDDKGEKQRISFDDEALSPRFPFAAAIGHYEKNKAYETVTSLSNNNLFVNDHCIVYMGGEKRRVYHRYKEPLSTRTYTCFVVRTDGTVGAERLRFVKGEDHDAVYRVDEPMADISSQVKYAIYGQQVIAHNKKVSIEKISNEFDDLFHLFRFPQQMIPDQVPPYGFAIGESELYQSLPMEGEKKRAHQRRLVTEALGGQPILIDLEPYIEKDGIAGVREALRQRQYIDVQTVQNDGVMKEGQYHIVGNKLIIRFYRYRMAHTLLGITQSGKVISCVIAGDKAAGLTGFGMTPEEARDYVYHEQRKKNDPVRDLFLISNGKDAFQQQNGKTLIQDTGGTYDKTSCAIVFAERKKQALGAPQEKSADQKTLHVWTPEELLTHFKDKPLPPVITGGGGFVGSHLADRILKEKGGQVVSLIRNRHETGKLQHLADNPDAFIVDIGDLTDTHNHKNLEKIIKKTETLYHVAAQPEAQIYVKDDIFNTYLTNVFVTGLIAQYAKKYGRKLIYGSTAHVYTLNPLFKSPIAEPVSEETPIPFNDATREFIQKAQEAFGSYIAQYVGGKTDLPPAEFVDVFLRNAGIYTVIERARMIKEKGEREQKSNNEIVQMILDDKEIPNDLFFGLYSISKIIPEAFVLHELAAGDGMALRFTNGYGERQRLTDVVGIFMSRLAAGKSVFASDHTRNFVHISDSVEALYRAGNRNLKENELFLIAHEEGPLSMERVLREIRPHYVEDPKTIALDVRSELPAMRIPHFDTAKAERLLGFKPRVSFADGIAQTIAVGKVRDVGEDTETNEQHLMDIIMQSPAMQKLKEMIPRRHDHIWKTVIMAQELYDSRMGDRQADLIQAYRDMRGNGAYLDKSLVQRVVAHYNTLTTREREILRIVLLLHDIGYVAGKDENMFEAQRNAEPILDELLTYKYITESEKDLILALIMLHDAHGSLHHGERYPQEILTYLNDHPTVDNNVFFRLIPFVYLCDVGSWNYLADSHLKNVLYVDNEDAMNEISKKWHDIRLFSLMQTGSVATDLEDAAHHSMADAFACVPDTARQELIDFLDRATITGKAVYVLRDLAECGGEEKAQHLLKFLLILSKESRRLGKTYFTFYKIAENPHVRQLWIQHVSGQLKQLSFQTISEQNYNLHNLSTGITIDGAVMEVLPDVSLVLEALIANPDDTSLMLGKDDIDSFLESSSREDQQKMLSAIEEVLSRKPFNNLIPQLRYVYIALRAARDNTSFVDVVRDYFPRLVDTDDTLLFNNEIPFPGCPKILLIGPYKSGDIKIGQFLAPPLGCYRIASFLKMFGLHVDVYDTDLDGEDGLAECIKKNSYDIIGFSNLQPTVHHEMNLMWNVHKIVPETLLIAGGQGAAFNQKLLFDHSPVSVVMRGWGEFPLLDVVVRWKAEGISDEALSKIPGIYYKKGESYSETQFNRSYTQDDLRLVSLTQDFSLVPYERYWEFMRHEYTDAHLKIMRNEKFLYTVRLYTESHCPMGCDFCSSTNQLDDAIGKKQKVLTLSAHDVFTMIKKAKRAHPEVKAVYFNDDNFMVHRKRVNELCDMLMAWQEETHEKLSFFCLSRVDTVDQEILHKMKNVGFEMIIYGVESFSENMLKAMEKKVNMKNGLSASEMALEAIQWTLNADIIPRLNLILFYPATTIEDLRITIDTAVDLIGRGIIVDPFTFIEAYGGATILKKGYPLIVTEHLINGIPVSFPEALDLKSEDMRIIASRMEKNKDLIDKKIKAQYAWEGKLPSPVDALSKFKAIYMSAKLDTAHIDTAIADLMRKGKNTGNSASRQTAHRNKIDIPLVRNALQGNVVTIDGPAGTGKSTVARMVARNLDFVYVTLGSINRAIAWKCLQENINVNDSDAITNLLANTTIEAKEENKSMVLYIDGVRMTNALLRSPIVSRVVAEYSQHQVVLDRVFQIGRLFGEEHNIVIDGRNAGTDIFPDTENVTRFYLEASARVRAQRRLNEYIMQEQQYELDIEAIEREIKVRDALDKSRPYAPLRKADDALEIDTTDMNQDEVTETIVREYHRKRLRRLCEQSKKKPFSKMLTFEGTSGIRGLADDLEACAKYLARAIAALPKNDRAQKIIVGYDTRESSVRIAEYVARILAHEGIEVVFLDKVMPSPMLSYKIAYDNRFNQNKNALAGIMITGSHNPAGDNGFCPRIASGAVMIDKDNAKFIMNKVKEYMAEDSGDQYESILFDSTPLENLPQVTMVKDHIEEVLDHTIRNNDLLNTLLALLESRGVDLSRVHIMYDAMKGAGANVLPSVLKSLGFQVTQINEKGESVPDLYMPKIQESDRKPYPNRERIHDWMQWEKEHGCNLVLSNDGDSDRFAVADTDFLDWNELFVLLIDFMGREGLLKKYGFTDIVATHTTTDALTIVAKKYGLRDLHPVPVGFKNISNKIRVIEENHGKVFAGFEGNGGMVLRFDTCVVDKDGVVANALFALLKAYSLSKGHVSLRDDIEETYTRLGISRDFGYMQEVIIPKTASASVFLRIMQNASQTLLGRTIAQSIPIDDKGHTKIYFTDGSWCVARSSGTEKDKMRLYVEAPTCSARNRLIMDLLDMYYGVLDIDERIVVQETATDMFTGWLLQNKKPEDLEHDSATFQTKHFTNTLKDIDEVKSTLRETVKHLYKEKRGPYHIAIYKSTISTEFVEVIRSLMIKDYDVVSVFYEGEIDDESMDLLCQLRDCGVIIYMRTADSDFEFADSFERVIGLTSMRHGKETGRATTKEMRILVTYDQAKKLPYDSWIYPITFISGDTTHDAFLEEAELALLPCLFHDDGYVAGLVTQGILSVPGLLNPALPGIFHYVIDESHTDFIAVMAHIVTETVMNEQARHMFKQAA